MDIESPYQLGIYAGWKSFNAECNDLPKDEQERRKLNPFQDGTKEHNEWQTGFSDGYDDALNLDDPWIE